MIKVQASARIKVFVDAIPDDGINKGGYYCKVFADENKEFEVNDFTLSRNYFKGIDNQSRKVIILNSLITDRVKSMYRK